MVRSSHSPAVAGPCSGALRIAHGEQGASGPGLVKGRKVHRTAAQCLRESREQLGWTIGRAATNYGVTAATWSAWESGSRSDGDAVAWILDLARDFRRSA